MNNAVIRKTGSEGTTLTFATMISSMFERADEKLIKGIAKKCCRFGGYPGTCECHEEVVNSLDWVDWPWNVMEFLHKFVKRIRRRMRMIAQKSRPAVMLA